MYIDFDEREAIKIAELEGAVEQGIEQGIEKGQEKKAIQVARNLLSMGLSLEQISKATGLNLKALKKLKAEKDSPVSH